MANRNKKLSPIEIEMIVEIIEEIFEEVSEYMTGITDVLEIYNSEWDKLFNNQAVKIRPELQSFKGVDFYKLYNEYSN